jgi:hypothetical protein
MSAAVPMWADRADIIQADLQITANGQAKARASRDDEALALWSRRRVATLRRAYPSCGFDGPWPCPGTVGGSRPPSAPTGAGRGREHRRRPT